MDVQIATCLKGPQGTDATLAEVGSNLGLMDSMAYEADGGSGCHEAKSELHVGLLAEDYLEALPTSSNQSPAFLSDPIDVTETSLPSPLSDEMDSQLATYSSSISSVLAEPINLTDMMDPLAFYMEELHNEYGFDMDSHNGWTDASSMRDLFTDPDQAPSVLAEPIEKSPKTFLQPSVRPECTEEDEIEERKRQIDILTPHHKSEMQNFSNSEYPAIPGLQERFLANPSPTLWRSDAPDFKIKPEATVPESQSDKNTCASQQMATGISVPATAAKPIDREKHLEKTNQAKQLSNPKRESILTRHAEALSKVMVHNAEGFLREDLRDYRHQMSRTDRISAENFNLKLDLLHTKERLYKLLPGDLDKVLKENIQYRNKAQEMLHECLRLRAMVKEANESITKVTRTEKYHKVCSNLPGKESKEEEDMHRHLQESNKCRKHFKVLNDKITRQDQEIKLLKNTLSQYRPRMPGVEPAAPNPKILTAQLLELDNLKRANQALRQEDEQLNAENFQTQLLLKNQLMQCDLIQSILQDGSFEKDKLRQMAVEFLKDISHLACTQSLLHTDLDMYKQEVHNLKDQLADLMKDSPPSPNLFQQQMLIDDLRHQLEEAKDRLAHSEPCAMCTACPNENSSDNEENPPQVRVIEEGKVTIAAQDEASSVELTSEEICHIQTASKAEVVKNQLPRRRDGLQQQSQAADKDDDLDGAVEPLMLRDDLLRRLFKKLASFVPIPAECDPLDDFKQFGFVIMDMVAAFTRLLREQAEIDAQPAKSVKPNGILGTDSNGSSPRDLEARLTKKSSLLAAATERITQLSAQCLELKGKTYTLKLRLVRVQSNYAALKDKVRRSEATALNSESLLSLADEESTTCSASISIGDDFSQ
ncbi:hypothetical protein L0F63_004455 [Massospora cicadina]|nr:hypothetical protein L0F63_004455 [Massospora cicadina]